MKIKINSWLRTVWNFLHRHRAPVRNLRPNTVPVFVQNRAAILAGLYGVDYEEVVCECGLGDEPGARILVRKVTN